MRYCVRVSSGAWLLDVKYQTPRVRVSHSGFAKMHTTEYSHNLKGFAQVYTYLKHLVTHYKPSISIGNTCTVLFSVVSVFSLKLLFFNFIFCSIGKMCLL